MMHLFGRRVQEFEGITLLDIVVGFFSGIGVWVAGRWAVWHVLTFLGLL